jgi:hypothetical protein
VHREGSWEVKLEYDARNIIHGDVLRDTAGLGDGNEHPR